MSMDIPLAPRVAKRSSLNLHECSLFSRFQPQVARLGSNELRGHIEKKLELPMPTEWGPRHLDRDH